ncbi:MAG: hypothetical protein P8180_17420, partial [Gammaproteobacteria bacterium]
LLPQKEQYSNLPSSPLFRSSVITNPHFGESAASLGEAPLGIAAVGGSVAAGRLRLREAAPGLYSTTSRKF